MSFEEYLNINYHENLDDLTKLLINDAFKAGAQSRQAEIEENYKIGYQDGFGSRQAEIDDFKKVIDEALDYANRSESISSITFITLYDILKGRL